MIRIAIRSLWGILLMLWGACAAAWPGESLLGPADVSAVIGQGALTVGVNPSGRISVCRWPSPGFHDQLRYRTISAESPLQGVSPRHGLMWGLRTAGAMHWLTGPPWTSRQRYAGAQMVETVSALSNGVSATQTVFTIAQRDAFVCHIEVSGLSAPPDLYWFAGFAPCTRLLPQLPLADWRLDDANDFAAFRDVTSQTTYHFRPNEVRAKIWNLARECVESRALAQRWSALGDGAWMGYASPNPVRAFQCGLVNQRGGPFEQAEAGALSGASSAAGRCESAVLLQPESRDSVYAATVYVAFGASMAKVDELLQGALGASPGALAAETEQAWRDTLAPLRFPVTKDPELDALANRCAVALLTAMDASSGAIVHAPITQPPLAVELPRHALWSTWAFDAIRGREQAARHAAFLAGLVRLEGRRAAPRGSLPFAAYANGVEASPSFWVDVQAAGAFLWTLSKHVEFLSENERAAFLGEHWNAIEAASDFLTAWLDPATRLPRPGFSPDRLRDVCDDELLVSVFVGMQNALCLATWAGADKPAWRERLTDVESLVRFRLLNDQNGWKDPTPLRFWFTGLVPAASNAWDVSIEAALAGLDAAAPDVLPDTLLALAMLSPPRPNVHAQLCRMLPSAMKRALKLSPGLPYAPNPVPIVVDTSAAAKLLLTISALFPE